ncbi:protein rep, partial [Helicobacter pylori]|uniref:protein rep n=1 Tax=Helicobacter pylori TaxID=210 RepID=UPI002AC6F6FB
HDKAKAIMQEKPHLKLVFITLTVKNGDDFLERFGHLEQSFQTLKNRRRDSRKKGRGFNEFSKVDGCVYSYEITNKKNGWHPHLHMVALVDDWIDNKKLSSEWEAITGDSKIIDVRRIKPDENGDYMEAFMECFKYCMKFSEMSKEHIWEVHEKLSPPKINKQGIEKRRLKRLHGSLGSFWGVKVSDELTDDKEETIGDNTPFMAILYSYRKSCYGVLEMQDFPFGQVSKENLPTALDDLLASGETLVSVKASAIASDGGRTTTRRSCDAEEEDNRQNELLDMHDWVNASKGELTS